MSIKKYFDVARDTKVLDGTTVHKVASQVESVGYHEQAIIKEERYIPQTDYSVPRNFARYGRATDYYVQATKRIYNTFPYDGSLRERLQWENESTYVDLYIYNDRYPRTNGYINFAADGWGTPSALYADGYGIPNTSADYEYIFFKGGPNANPDAGTSRKAQFTGSNYYEPSKNRGSNLALNVASRGTSVEFWLKKDSFDKTNTEKEVIFDLWNGVTSSATNYARMRLELTASERRDGLPYGAQPFLLTLYSGSTGFFQQTIASSTITTTGSVADGNWHHYAVTLKQDTSVTTRFYVDGRLNREQHLSASGMGSLSDISGLNLRAQLGSLVASPRASVTPQYAGKLSASLDEFRFWKAQRTSQEIGRFWFTQVGGGVNTDPEPFIETEVSANLNLGVYFKFNEGITGIPSTDSTVLDYSGRFSNGSWTCPAITAGDVTLARSTESAIVLSNAATSEYKDPIIYASNPNVSALLTELENSGSSYDVNNNASIYNSMPAWIIEEDDEGEGELRKLTQIIASYFDTLHLQIRDLNSLKDIGYVSGSNKPLPFAEKLLSSYGFVAPEIFVDADILNTLANRSEDKIFEKPLEEVKNIIYKNIYNNLVYIYKSKGTEKAFRNLIRCFGIDDELVKLNMYANDIEFDLRNNRRNVTVTDRFVNFNTGDNKYGTVYNYKDPTNPQSTGYISGSAALLNGHALTLESEILFPLKPLEADDVYISTNTISSSLFGMHGVQSVHAAHSDSHTTWASDDVVNFQVYAVRDEVSSDNVRFVLTSSGPRGKVPYLASELFEDVYNNTRWNLAVRIKPEKYPLSSLVDGATAGNYTIELHGVQGDSGEILQEFTVAKTITAPATFITSSRRAYIGAHRTNFTGSMLSFSDVRVNATRYWLDYVEDAALSGHILDTENYGTLHAHRFAYPFNTSSSYGDIQKADTLVFNWEFLTNTGSNAAGQFSVADLTSGSLVSSTNALTASYGALGQILNRNYTARGSLFATSSTTVIDKDFVISSKLNLPENLQSQEMVKVLSATDQDVFTSDSRPTNYFFAFEKSMYQTISEEMINYFATLKDFHNLIGEPVNQWRPEYKSISFLKQKFFENVENDELDFDKFYEFYKWFDSALSSMLAQLAPASADIAENVRTVIENHILERPKYQRKFPFLEKSDTTDPTARIDGNMGADKSAQGSPDEFPQGTSFFTNTAFTRRQIGSSNTSQTRPWKHFHAPARTVIESPGIAKSLLFDGDDEYVDIGNGGWDDLIGGNAAAAKEYSISFWYKPASMVDAYPYLYSFGNGSRNLIVWGAVDGGYIRASNRSNNQNLAQTAVGALSIGVWTHITVTFGGGNTGLTAIYLDGADATDSTDISQNPTAINTTGADIGERTPTTYSAAGNYCDFAVWNKELSAAEVTQIYASGERMKLSTVTFKANLLSWYKMGSDPRDTYNGTIYDQVGGRNGTPVNFDSAADIEADSPAFISPYSSTWGPPPNKNMYWHRYMEEFPASSRDGIRGALSQSFNRRTYSPVKFSVEGTTAVGGVSRHHNSVVNYVFQAARAWGNLGPRVASRGRPVMNKLVSSGSSVEELISSPDVFYPNFKQRLGFGLSASNGDSISGPRHAPFSLYSSSVTTGFNAEVVANYASGVMITNLHNDFVIGTDVPMQGPFTEKYVGGRFYRHTALNEGTDTNLTRGEGFRIEFDNGGSDNVLGVSKKSLVILPPNSRTGSTDPDARLSGPAHWPTAYRFREVAAKRPVNIKNIQMRTGSTIIGNYEKNYQVVNTNSRMKNDPFFNDQSFNFALYPETLATRGRFPLYVPEPVVAKSILFDASIDTMISDDDYEAWESALSDVAGDGLTISFWFNYSSHSGTPRMVNLGAWYRHPTNHDGLSIYLYDTGTKINLYAALRDDSAAETYAQATTNLSTDTWYHAVVEFPAGSLDGTDTAVPVIYLNNSLEVLAGSDGRANWGGLGALGYGISLGDHPNLTDPYDGYLCDVAIINRTITPAERALLYNSGERTNIALDGLGANLVAYYRLGNKSAQGNADSTSGVIYNSVINDIPNATPANFTSATTNGITDQSPSTLSPETDWPTLFGPLQKPTANPGGNLNYALPARTGSASNQTVIVNRYAGSGYEVMSRGYMDPAHEELSVYNANPYHNLSIIDHGLSGNVAADPLAAKTITVVDQIGKNRGLDQRFSLHCGPFGSDAAFGSVPELTYVTVPSYIKTNRNRKRRMYSAATRGAYYTASVYDNRFVQHAIPQSPQQYAWITASVVAGYGNAPMAFAPPGVLSASTLNQLVTGSDFPYYGDGFRNNFAKFGGPSMRPPSVDIQSRTSQAHLGTYSGQFRQFIRSAYPSVPLGTGVGIGSAAAWNDIIGQSGASARAFTWSAWIYQTAYNSANVSILFTVGRPGAGLSGRYLALRDTGQLEFVIYDDSPGSGMIQTADDVIKLNTWHHITATYAGGAAGAMAIYVDGVRISNLSVNTAVGDPVGLAGAGKQYSMFIGAGYFNWIQWSFIGYMADAAIWGTAAGGAGTLSDAQVKKLYNGGSPLNIKKKLSTGLVAWYRFNPWLGDNISLKNKGTWNTDPSMVHPNGIIRNAVTGSGLGSGVDTEGTAYNLELRRFSPFQVDQLNNYLNNQNGPYGWPTWKQIRVGETPVARALSKNNYIGQVVPAPRVPLLMRGSNGSMFQRGTVLAQRPNTATLYYEPPINDKMGIAEFYFEDNTDASDPNNSTYVAVPYGNNLEYFNSNGLNNRLGLSINLNKPMIFDTVRNFLVESNLSTVIKYTEKMYPSQDNIYRARIRGRTSYDISGIWNSVRSVRSSDGGLTGSMGQTEGKKYATMTGSNSSVWPLDGHMNFTTTSSVRPWDGAGELMNSYSRYSGSVHSTGISGSRRNLGTQTAAPTYATRIPIGVTATHGESFPILAGDTKWTAPTEAGKDPYENYSTWAARIKLAGQDQSLIPEFRISQHLHNYYDKHAGNFLTDKMTGIYEISGASIPNSSRSGFFKTYSNSDFMKYFRSVDSSLNDQRSGEMKIERDRIILKAEGLIKFLPYKGFYPAERTLQIATMFSQSYGSSLLKGSIVTMGPLSPTSEFNTNQCFRIALEPLFAPGIMYNTIKSGLAVGHCVLVNTASYKQMQPHSLPMLGKDVEATKNTYPEGTLYYKRLLQLGTGSKGSMGYHIAKVPFETIQDPSQFFNAQNILALGRTRAVIGDIGGAVAIPGGTRLTAQAILYDTAIPGMNDSLSGSHASFPTAPSTGGYLPIINFTLPKKDLSVSGRFGTAFLPWKKSDPQVAVKLADPEGGYRYAIDNFLCETTNFFMNGITSLRSNREEQFQTVRSGSVYTATMRLFRSDRDSDNDSRWDMYSRASAFGFPLCTQLPDDLGAPRRAPTFSHLLPPYYGGEATAELIYTASYTGKPTVDEIFSQLKIRYNRQSIVANYSASIAVPAPGVDSLIPASDKTGGRFNDPRMQIDSSFNLTEKIQEVPVRTATQQNYWLIQSKFETPILNFANVTQSVTPGGTGLITSRWSGSATNPSYPGDLVQTSSANLVTRGMWHQYGSVITSSTAGVFAEIVDGGAGASLSDVVGFQKGVTTRVGDIKKNAVLEEAIVAIPFMVKKGRREFFAYTGTSRNTSNYANVETAMLKYIFPPKFDFVRVREDAQEAADALESLITSGPILAGSLTDKRRVALQRAAEKAADAAAKVQPVLMYVFEFSVQIDEQDIADMWQNLPPSIAEKTQSAKEVEIEDRDLLRVMADNTQPIRWMVFKVKKRAKRDFDVYKRSLVTRDTSALAPKLKGPYTYNWPYDYFSLVELASIDATVQWTSGDMQHEIEDDDMITLDGRPPLRGTDGAPPVLGRATPPLPGSNDGNPATGRSAPTTDSGPNTERSPAPRQRRSREASTTRRARTRSRRDRNGGGNNGGRNGGGNY